MFDPNKSIWELPVFKYTVSILVVIAVVLIVIILRTSNLELDLTYNGFNAIFSYFKFPLAILTLIIPIVALIAANHRSEQTREQLMLTNGQNNFTNYYKHLEEFERFCAIDSSNSYFTYDIRHIHSLIFTNAKNGDYCVDNAFITQFEEYLTNSFQDLSLIPSSESTTASLSNLIFMQGVYHRTFGVSEPKWESTHEISGKTLPFLISDLVASIQLNTLELSRFCEFDTSFVASDYIVRVAHFPLDRFKGINIHALEKLESVTFEDLVKAA